MLKNGNAVEIPLEVSALIFRILDGWEPVPPMFAEPVRMSCGGQDMSGSVRELTSGGDALRIRLIPHMSCPIA
jgi:hypothetical protein